MKRIPFLLGLALIILTLTRVADFTGAGTTTHYTILAWAFASGLTISVFTSAYFMNWKSTRSPALWILVFCLFADGLFNFFETVRWSIEIGMWNQTVQLAEGVEIPIYRIGHTLYGLSPTVLAAMLGWLAQKTEGLGNKRRRDGFIAMLKAELIAWLRDDPAEPAIKTSQESANQSQSGAEALQDDAEQSQDIAEQSQDIAEQSHECEYCGKQFATPQAVAAHKRFCEHYKSQKEQK